MHGLLEFFRIVVGNRRPLRIEQRALAIALEHRAEIPAVAVVVGELRVLELRIERRHSAQEFRITPFAADRRFLGIAVEDFARLGSRRVALLLRPHERRVGLVVPHDVAVERIHEHVRLVHVAHHALRRRNGARERVLQRMAGFIFGNGRVGRLRHARVAKGRVGSAVLGIAIVGVDRVATRTARRAIVSRLLVGAQKPHLRIVQPGLGDVDHRHRNSAARARTAIGLFQVGSPRFFQFLQRTAAVGHSDFGELTRDHAPAALEYAEDIAGNCRLPRGQRIQFPKNAFFRHERIDRNRIDDGRALALRRVGLAQYIALERQDSVVVRGTSPQHHAGRHHAAFGGLDGRQVACTARFARDTIVAGVHKADELGRFAIEQRVAARRIRARRIFPRQRKSRQHVGVRQPRSVGGVLYVDARRPDDQRIPAVTIGAAQDDGGVGVHRGVVRGRVATHTPARLDVRRVDGLPFGRRGLRDVRTRDGVLALRAHTRAGADQHEHG